MAPASLPAITISYRVLQPRLAIVPTQPRRLFVWMHAGGLFRSDDGSDSWAPVETEEALRRSTGASGQTALVIDPSDPERVYLGNASVLQFVNQ